MILNRVLHVKVMKTSIKINIQPVSRFMCVSLLMVSPAVGSYMSPPSPTDMQSYRIHRDGLNRALITLVWTNFLQIIAG